MNKTIFRVDYKISVLVLSIAGIFIGLISSMNNVDGFLEFVFYFIKQTLLCGVLLFLCLKEEKNSEFKSKLKYLFGNVLIVSIVNFVFSIFSIFHLIPFLFTTLSSLLSLFLIFMFSMEIIALYYKSDWILKVINFNKKTGDMASTPVIRLIDKITND